MRGREAARVPDTAGADEAGAGIVVAEELRPCPELRRMEAGLVRHAIGLRVAQQAVPGQDGVERPHEPAFDVHGVEIGIAEIGADLVDRELAVAREFDAARPVLEVGEDEAPHFERLLRRQADPRLGP